MENETKQAEIELRSEEFQEIVAQSPRWIIRSGITLVFGFLIVFFAGSYFFSYPDLVEAKILICSADSVNQSVADSIGNKPHHSRIYGKILLSMAQSRKVVVGQDVNIVLDDYPAMEFGAIEGRVTNILPIHNTSNFLAEVSFLNSRYTRNKKIVELYPEMKGSATIITHDIRLIERFVKPVKAYFK